LSLQVVAIYSKEQYKVAYRMMMMVAKDYPMENLSRKS